MVQKNLQTAPFYLIIKASNHSINNDLLTSCHEGAAVEGLCLTKPLSGSGSMYTLNYSSQGSTNQGLGTSGVLTWILQIHKVDISSSMKLKYTPISNVAVPLFTSSESSTEVGFDDENQMFIPGSFDDRNPYVVISTPAQAIPKPFYRWFVCETNAGYSYQTLAWVLGIDLPPQNPSCQKVDVKRSFVQPCVTSEQILV